MPVPDQEKMMFLILEQLSDKERREFQDMVAGFIKMFGLTEEDLDENARTVGINRFRHIMNSAKLFLEKARLIECPGRSVMQITQRGIDILKQNPETITAACLRQYPEFIEYLYSNKEIADEGSPEEEYHRADSKLIEKLLDKILQLPPAYFENLVIELLLKMGYGSSFLDSGIVVGRSGDEGIDGIIKEDKLGLDTVYIQAKRWSRNNIVGRPEIQKFVGALTGKSAKKGIFITTSSFTQEAKDFTPMNDTRIVLLDGEAFAQHMIEHGIGIYTADGDELEVDDDYFKGR
jgi:restriction system protein